MSYQKIPHEAEVQSLAKLSVKSRKKNWAKGKKNQKNQTSPPKKPKPFGNRKKSEIPAGQAQAATATPIPTRLNRPHNRGQTRIRKSGMPPNFPLWVFLPCVQPSCSTEYDHAAKHWCIKGNRNIFGANLSWLLPLPGFCVGATPLPHDFNCKPSINPNQALSGSYPRLGESQRSTVETSIFFRLA